MPEYTFNFTIHGTLTLNAVSEEEAYDLIREGFNQLELPTEALRKAVTDLTVNEVEPELMEEE